jgi:4'-phosphopantetheinyl transferase EntD
VRFTKLEQFSTQAPGNKARIATAFDELLPPDAFAVEARPHMWCDGLLPAERDIVARCVPKRIREFTAGRNCARAALALAGLPVIPILTHCGRAPLFPSGVSGTITHTQTYCAAAVIRIGTYRSIGIDAEPNGPLSMDTLEMISSPAERRMLGQLGNVSRDHWDRLLFSIKESFFKAFFQVTPEFLDFKEASVEIVPERREFVLKVVKENVAEGFRNISFTGRYRVEETCVFSAVGLRAIV